MTDHDTAVAEWAAEKKLSLPKDSHCPAAAFALGMATVTEEGEIIEVKYLPAAVSVGENQLSLDIINAATKGQVAAEGTVLLSDDHVNQALAEFPDNLFGNASSSSHANVWALRLMARRERGGEGLAERGRVPIIHVSPDLMAPPSNLAEVYLRLMTQSLRKTMPGVESSIVPGEAFPLLPNVVWSLAGVHTPDEFDQVDAEMAMLGMNLQDTHQDKIPRLLDYVRPRGARFGDGDRARLGCWVGDGATIMHEGFLNFNAVVLGPNMIEGRVSAGVVIGAGTDVGGGVSTLGTMSGGNAIKVSTGEGCLLAAESVLGIPIGDRVHLAANTAIIGSMPVYVADISSAWIKCQDKGAPARETLRLADWSEVDRDKGPVVLAADLAGINDAIIRVDSQSGRLECHPRGEREWPNLTDFLHTN